MKEQIISGLKNSYESIVIAYKEFTEIVAESDEDKENIICISSILNLVNSELVRYYIKAEFVDRLSQYKPDVDVYKANDIFILKEGFTKEEAQVVILDIKALPENWK